MIWNNAGRGAWTVGNAWRREARNVWPFLTGSALFSFLIINMKVEGDARYSSAFLF